MVQLSYRLLLTVPIVSTPESQLLEVVQCNIENSQSFVIFTPNPEILLAAHHNKELQNILSNNQINIPDGEGVALFLGIPAIKGRLFMLRILSSLEKFKKRVYIVGSSESVISQVLEKIKIEYPLLQIEGSSGPILNTFGQPINKEQEVIQEALLHTMNSFKPDMIFAAFGAPKQEFWVQELKKKFPQCSFMVVGGALDTYSGIKHLPHPWIVSLKLEWFYRLLREPQRIQRIMNAVIVFPLTVVYTKLFTSSSRATSR